MNFLKIGIIAILISALAVACKSGADKATTIDTTPTIRYGIVTDPGNMDPFIALGADARAVLFNIFEGLVKPTVDGGLVPAVAERYSISDDFKSFSFTLRDVTFHNGAKVTASDVKYSLEKAIEYHVRGMENIRAIEIIDDANITVHLKQPDNEFLYCMTTAIVPAGYANHATAPIGTGPFKFEHYTPQQEVALTKHSEYWNPALPKVDRFIFKIKTDLTSVLLDLQAGSLDMGTIDTKSVSQLSMDKFNVDYVPSNSIQLLALNNKVAALSDKRVRKAISYVVDFNEIIEIVHNGHAVRASSPVNPALKAYYNTALDSRYQKDVALAKSLMAEAGYGDGFSVTITVPSVYQQHTDTAQLVVNQLAEINIKASINLVDWATWLSDVYVGRKYEMTIISVDGATLSPKSYLERYNSADDSNFVNYSNPEFDALFASLDEITNEEDKIAAYKRLQEILSDDAASVFICDIAGPKAYVKGVSRFINYPMYITDASLIEIIK